jgi:hypothetical protein
VKDYHFIARIHNLTISNGTLHAISLRAFPGSTVPFPSGDDQDILKEEVKTYLMT